MIILIKKHMKIQEMWLIWTIFPVCEEKKVNLFKIIIIIIIWRWLTLS